MANEVGDLLAEGMGGMGMMDEGDLEDELAELEAEDASEAMLAAPMAPGRGVSSEISDVGKAAFNEAMSLPSAPSGQVQLSEEEAELEALQASMGM